MAFNMANNGGGRRGRRVYKPMSDMNVTPFVDVMLVLLIIFMVAAPMMTQGVQVQLPKADAKPIEQEKPVEVALQKDGTIRIGSSIVPADQLIPRLQAVQENRESAAILLKADKELDYGSVMRVMAALQTAGMVDIGLVTDPIQ